MRGENGGLETFTLILPKAAEKEGQHGRHNCVFVIIISGEERDGSIQ